MHNEYMQATAAYLLMKHSWLYMESKIILWTVMEVDIQNSE